MEGIDMEKVAKPAVALLPGDCSYSKNKLWKNRLDDALRHLDDRSALNRNPLSRLLFVKKLASTKYCDKTMPAGLALKELIVAAIDGIAADIGDDPALSRLSNYLVYSKQGLNRRQISQKLGLSREHVSREIRPRALELLGQVMRLKIWQAEHSQLSLKK
jgi:hypothetical protein